MYLHFCLYSLLITSSFAFQLPFKLPFFKSTEGIVAELEAAKSAPRIAVIGAGAAGSSAAFWISKAKQRFGIHVDVDVYERASYIGGRSTTVYPYNDSTLEPIELGASIFVDVNKNMMRAAKEFNLALKDFDESSDMGIWDGSHFNLVLDNTNTPKSWWSTLKVLWRYGYRAPTKTQAIVNNMITRFVGLYTTESPRWDDIADLASTFAWTDMVNHTTVDYFVANGVSQQYSQEMIEAATRVNYGQNVDKIHALEGACSLAATGASGVTAGNFRIFENFLNHSDAQVLLNTDVKEVKRVPDSSLWIVRSSSGSQYYRGVILAAPFHQSNITIPSDLAELIPPQPYVHLHVTLLTTLSETPNPEYFGLRLGTQVPRMVLTTYEGVREGGVKPEFNSLSYHGRVQKYERCEEQSDDEDAEAPEWIVKIFSDERITDEWLENVFGNVGWVLRKEWDAYPLLPPTTTFPPVRLDQGLYYVNAFEPFISTMETETIASRNVVDLLLHEEFGSGICGSLLSGSEANDVNKSNAADDGGFVLGWDC
ncbi:FAD/NAD(P)-binding domain-containing protein [Phlebopus sp. FC_14]|nr:FAD/NAD(P)-binding domain-containing protein [Phlebopus sp. FC_14]